MQRRIGLAGPIAATIVVIATLLTGSVAGGDAPSVTPEAVGEPVTGPSPPPVGAAETDVLLVWGHGGTNDGLAEAVRSIPGVLAVSAVNVDRRDLLQAVTEDGTPTVDLPEGWMYPLETAAIDPEDHAAVLPAAEILEGLEPGTALLGATSARLRGLGPGSVVTLEDGTEHTIVGVLDDRVAGFAELIVHPDDATAIDIERYLLVRHEGDAASIAASIQAAAGEQLRISPMADVTYPRHGDGVLPQVVLKDQFGEFPIRDAPGRGVTIGATWRNEHLVASNLPRVGHTLCHRTVTEAFEAVLRDLEGNGLLEQLSPSRYQGCWVGRVIGASRTLSHHSWGVAVDVNVNPSDVFTSDLSDEVIATFERHGFVWGGDFLRPDEPHFEYVGDLLDR